MSKRFMKSAFYSVHKLFAHATELSFKTRYDYEKDLMLVIKQLHEQGIQISDIRHLKERHVSSLITLWQQQSLNIATIKNRLSKLRYACRQIDKPNLISTMNVSLGIGKRQYLPKRNKAITELDISKFFDKNIQLSVQLQQQFGLRREECLKFIPSKADKGTYIELQGSWTKGGIPRTIPVTTAEQRMLLDTLRQQIPAGQSLIPPDKSYRQQENTYVRQVRESGYRNLHGLRHAYAQQRYRTLTAEMGGDAGWDSPINGGITALNMSSRQRDIDHVVRLKISEELGHSRIGITKIYCG